MPKNYCGVCCQFHEKARHACVVGQGLAFSSLSAANVNFGQVVEPVVRKRMTAQEAMAYTKLRYKETLDYLA
jgi:hypothetical protein